MKSFKHLTCIAAFGLMSTYATAANLGQTGLNKFQKINSCKSNAQKVRNFRMVVDSGSAYLKNVTLVFGNNKTKQIQLNDNYMGAGDRKRVKLERARCIKAVIITGEAIDRGFNISFKAKTRGSREIVDNIIRPGDSVVEKSGTWSVQTVKYITEGGQYNLSNGQTYESNYIKKLVPAYQGFNASEEVLEVSGTWSIQRISKISSDGSFLLGNGHWYEKSYIVKLLTKKDRIALNQEVLEVSGTWSTQRVTKIAENGSYLLGNGHWYDKSYIRRLVSSYDGIYVGDKVLETSGTHSTQRVTKIDEQGNYLLGNGQWYARSYIQKIYQ